MGYYSLELSQGSAAWERVDRFFRTHFGCSHFDGVPLQRIVAIYNPKYALELTLIGRLRLLAVIEGLLTHQADVFFHQQAACD